MRCPLLSLFGLGLGLVLPVACANTGLDTLCEPNAHKCVGSTSLLCASDGSGWQVEQDCAKKSLLCTSTGCRVCVPSGFVCQGQNIMRCRSDGSGLESSPTQTCDDKRSETCFAGECVNACDLAQRSRSYVGCEYWPVDLDNAVVPEGIAAAQQYAVVLSNPSSMTAQVRVLVNDAPYGQPVQSRVVTERTVAPDALEVIQLPSREVDGSPPGEYNLGTNTALTSNAYKIESTAPIIVYQFNPLSNVGVFSNDASLLLPATALTLDSSRGSGYLVMGWPQTIATTDDPKTNFGVDLRAFLTIVGTRESTHVRVTLATDIVGDGQRVPAKKRGETLEVTLNPFDVLNLETGGFAADFTGSSIETDWPVVVYSGSEASDVPDFPDLTERKCCADHLEEQLFPTSTLGTTFIAMISASRTQAVKDAGAALTPHPETETLRLLAVDAATVTTSLPSPNARMSVDRGKLVQLQSNQDFVIQSTKPLVVGHFMASQDVSGIPSTLPGGDPSFILLPPVEQFRKEYLFLTPDKYAFDFINVAAPREARVTLDGRPLVNGRLAGPGRRTQCTLSSVGKVVRPGEKSETEFVAYKCQLNFPKLIPGKTAPNNLDPGERNDGVHRLSSDQPVGLVVYGFDAYVSYGYPGGTDLALINLQ
jgi:hypothetical protein